MKGKCRALERVRHLPLMIILQMAVALLIKNLVKLT
jgi:hypothetical protein